MGLKTCVCCKIEYELSNFSKKSERKDKINPRCKTCTRLAGKIYREANKEKELLRAKKYKLANKEKVKAANKLYIQKNIERVKVYAAKYRETHRELYREAVKKHRLKYPEKERQRSRDFYHNNTDQARDIRFRSKYGITMLDYKHMLEAQNGTCQICKLPPTSLGRTGKPKLLAVDHCHTTRKVRGLLCQTCNLGLGGFEDNIPRIQAAIDYINRSKLTG